MNSQKNYKHIVGNITNDIRKISKQHKDYYNKSSLHTSKHKYISTNF